MLVNHFLHQLTAISRLIVIVVSIFYRYRATSFPPAALDDATADGRDKLLATAMVQQFEKTFPELLTAAGTEVQIIETDGF
jgi:hypothetical protein